MSGEEGRQFTGSAEDYLDWFKGVKFEKVILPPSQTDGEGLPALDNTPAHLPLMPEYLRREQSRDYAQKYQEEFLKDMELAQQSGQNKERSRPPTIMDLETVTRAASDDENLDNCDRKRTQVYLHYDFTKRDSQDSLPIFDVQKEILRHIYYYQVTVIKGETGCGKSTQVPQFILDEAVEEHRHCNVVVTQPRKIAAISLARRVCRERGWVVGKLVGYQVGLDTCLDSDTRLTYVTTEVLVQKLIRNRSLDRYTHIILDEVHERDEHTDFALLVVKKLLRTVSPRVKVILMSATIDASKFAKYFSTPVLGHLLPAPVISAGSATVHPIQTFYLEDLSPLCKHKPHVLPELPTVNPDEPRITEGMLKLATELLKCFDIIERQEEGLTETEFATRRGAVLAFLPGLGEIEEFVGLLDKEKNNFQWQMYPLHSSITKDEQQLVFTTPPHGFRKIIMSTNIAESSITVPDIKYVIDFCLTKELSCDVLTNFTSLKLVWTSRASCRQRAGRCGRVSPGRVYRLIPQRFFETLAPYATPELCRTPLSQVVLKTKILAMGEPHALLALALDPPLKADICRTVLVLKQMGALAVRSNGKMSEVDGDLTYLGQVVARLPVDPYLAKFIVLGYIFGCLRECVIIAAGLSLKSFHARPFQDELNAFLSKVSWAYGSFSDCFAVLNTYELWQNIQVKGEFQRPGGRQDQDWARHSYVQLSVLQDIHTLVKELHNRLKFLKITPRNKQNPPKHKQILIIKMCLAGAFFPQYYTRCIPEDYEREACRTLGGHDPFTTVVLSGLPSETNILYDAQIRTLFHQCSQNLQIYYDGSRAYLQFPRLGGSAGLGNHFQDIPGECPTALHLALKMRQIKRIRQGLTLTLFSHEESRSRMLEVLDHGNGEDAEGSLSNSALSERGSLPKRRATQAAPSLDVRFKPPILPSPTNHTMNVHISYVQSAGHFWVTSNEGSSAGKLQEMQTRVEWSVRQGIADHVPHKMVTPGRPVIAEYTDPYDGITGYYRARVEEIFPDPDENTLRVLIFFVDYGNSGIVDAHTLRMMPASLVEQPMLAVECMLSEVKPRASSGDGSWGEKTTAWFRTRTLYRNFTVQIYSVVQGIVRARLLEHDLMQGSFISLNDLLISLGYAVRAEEVYLSKQNHELRAIYSCVVEETDHESMTSDFSYLSLKFNSNPSSFAGKVNLRGPDSPLLLKFAALTRTGGCKIVRIDDQSVNSTAIDLEPQNPHDKLLLAASVTLDPSESGITLRNTTLMPSIPGITTLCLLLFSPVAELRVNKIGTHYTGALFGLGCHERSGVAIYPDDDIEYPFDINVTQDDLIMINKIRFLINAVLEEGEYVSDDMLVSTQKQLRDFIIKLLDEKREYKEPEYYHQAYQWLRIPEEDILRPDTGGALDDPESSVFPLHCGIVLRPENLQEEIVSKLEELKMLKDRGQELVKSERCPLCDVTIGSLAHLKLHFYTMPHKKAVNLWQKSHRTTSH
ncbi:hypothetical protein Pmani_008893 [Petrolisthes manimaculis]|uniref:Probable ATP-dependent RNA helicase spindle-E n=1 Tax=Petrolisthes manimaculis TaxID=1843537 RepID=A0AAE1Q7I6_9EUCA|nr:hypothetical protein Pmani_008893 [Petrolisthes manimaculis]